MAADDPTPGTDPAYETPSSVAGAPSEAAPLTDQPKSGGLGGILDAILRGLAPTVRKARRRRVRARRTSPWSRSSSSGGGSGTLLALRYHDGATSSWTTTRVAFGRRGNRIAVISSSDARWWHHIRSGSPIQVRVRNQWIDGRARLLSRDEDTYARAVGIFVEDHSRAAAQGLGVPMDEQGRLDHGARRPGDAVVVWIEVDTA